MNRPLNRDVIFEFHSLGNAVKVTAFDTESLTEISIVGSRGMSEDILKNNAMRKLEFVLRKKGIIG